MKALRLSSLAVGVAAALASAGPVAAAPVLPTGGTGSQAAKITVPKVLFATFPSSPFSWSLAPGTSTSAAQNVNVKSNAAWALRVFADHSPMTIWDGTAYGTSNLANPVQLTVNGGAAQAVPQATSSSGVANVYSTTDTAARAAGFAGITLAAAFQQDFSYADTPGDYQSTVTFAADQAF
jgi:hypothetical protein